MRDRIQQSDRRLVLLTWNTTTSSFQAATLICTTMKTGTTCAGSLMIASRSTKSKRTWWRIAWNPSTWKSMRSRLRLEITRTKTTSHLWIASASRWFLFRDRSLRSLYLESQTSLICTISTHSFTISTHTKNSNLKLHSPNSKLIQAVSQTHKPYKKIISSSLRKYNNNTRMNTSNNRTVIK